MLCALVERNGCTEPVEAGQGEEWLVDGGYMT